MKTWILIALAILLIQQRAPMMDYYIQHYSELPEKVVMYGTPSCGYCVQARNFFDELGVPYVEYNVDRNLIAQEEFRQLGGRGTPLIIIEGEVVQGFSPDSIRLALM